MNAEIIKEKQHAKQEEKQTERIRSTQINIQTKKNKDKNSKTKPLQICRNITVFVIGLIESIHVFEFRNDNTKVGCKGCDIRSNVC